jgi:hypothetical protein
MNVLKLTSPYKKHGIQLAGAIGKDGWCACTVGVNFYYQLQILLFG